MISLIEHGGRSLPLRHAQALLQLDFWMNPDHAPGEHATMDWRLAQESKASAWLSARKEKARAMLEVKRHELRDMKKAFALSGEIVNRPKGPLPPGATKPLPVHGRNAWCAYTKEQWKNAVRWLK